MARVTVEIPLFFTIFAFNLSGSVDTNLLIFRTCYALLGYDKQNCSLLGKVDNNVTRDLEKIVQPKADMIIMTKSMVDNVTAVIICLFIGAWSDKFGRKPILLANMIGFVIAYWIMIVFSAMENASPWFAMTTLVPVALTGGGASLITILLAYLIDVSSDDARGFRLGVFELVMGVAMLAGSLLSPYLLHATNYVVVYSIGMLSCLFALLYVQLWLPESLHDAHSNMDKFKDLFRIRTNVTNLLRTGFRSRPHYNRSILLLTVLALALLYVIIAGDGSVMFLFLRTKFNWTLEQYTWYNCTTTVIWIFSTFFVVYVVHHKCGVTESIVILVGFISLIGAMMVQGFAQAGWMIYAAYCVKIPYGGVNPLARSMLSKLVEADERAKIFALLSLVHYLLSLVGSPMYTTLYNATISTFPGMFNFLTCGIVTFSVLAMIGVIKLQKSPVVETEDTEVLVDHEVS